MSGRTSPAPGGAEGPRVARGGMNHTLTAHRITGAGPPSRSGTAAEQQGMHRPAVALVVFQSVSVSASTGGCAASFTGLAVYPLATSWKASMARRVRLGREGPPVHAGCGSFPGHSPTITYRGSPPQEFTGCPVRRTHPRPVQGQGQHELFLKSVGEPFRSSPFLEEPVCRGIRSATGQRRKKLRA